MSDDIESLRYSSHLQRLVYLKHQLTLKEQENILKVLLFQILSNVKSSIALFEYCRGSPACLGTVSTKMQMSM